MRGVRADESSVLDRALGVWLLERFGGVVLSGTAGRLPADSASVMDALGLRGDPVFESMSLSVLEDTEKPRGLSSLSHVLSLFQEFHSDEIPAMSDLLSKAIEAEYLFQLRFWYGSAAKALGTAEVKVVSDPNGKSLEMVTVASDLEFFSTYAFSIHTGRKIASVIQQLSDGRVQIYANPHLQVPHFYDVVQMVRVMEQRVRKREVTRDHKNLSEPGRILGAEEWEFCPEGYLLQDGVPEEVGVGLTQLEIFELQDAVQIWLQQSFDTVREADCREGKCSSTFRNQCLFYVYGFHRCRYLRWLKHQLQEERSSDERQPVLTTA